MINLFEFNNYKIDTKKLDHLLHVPGVRKLEEQICEYVEQNIVDHSEVIIYNRTYV